MKSTLKYLTLSLLVAGFTGGVNAMDAATGVIDPPTKCGGNGSGIKKSVLEIIRERAIKELNAPEEEVVTEAAKGSTFISEEVGFLEQSAIDGFKTLTLEKGGVFEKNLKVFLNAKHGNPFAPVVVPATATYDPDADEGH